MTHMINCEVVTMGKRWTHKHELKPRLEQS
jgi:hypothetical protein